MEPKVSLFSKHFIDSISNHSIVHTQGVLRVVASGKLSKSDIFNSAKLGDWRQTVAPFRLTDDKVVHASDGLA